MSLQVSDSFIKTAIRPEIAWKKNFSLSYLLLDSKKFYTIKKSLKKEKKMQHKINCLSEKLDQKRRLNYIAALCQTS